jgi:transcriptional regulator with XRE-family HTH domain
LLDQVVLWRLASAAMTDLEDLDARRRGYWLRRARDNAGVTLADAAVTAGLQSGSGSTVSLWERGLRPMKVHQMKRLAVRYGVPVSLFIDPPMTDDERLATAIADAAALEREDSDEAAGARPRAGGGPVAPRHRRLA